MFNNLVIFQQYCKKYGKSHDGLADLCLNLRRNGLMTPWSYYALHEPYQLTREDYLNGRVIEEPLVIYDCDRPVNTCAAFISPPPSGARDLRQKPVYVLNHAQTGGRGRSTMSTLEEHQAAVASLARRMWKGSGLGPDDVDIFNPYDGYLTFTQQFLEVSSGTASSWAKPTTSMPTTSGLKGRILSCPAAATTGPVGREPASSPTASSSCGARPERGR